MYKIVITEYFKKQLRPLVKKERALKKVLQESLLSFDTRAKVSLGRGLYKLRLPGQQKGKSGGYRVLIFVVEIGEILVPVTMYAKNIREQFTKKEIRIHLEHVKKELEERRGK